ncbi:MAG: SDR family oxidoreductase [Betaproteobacteria bacterium]|nr:SDR family oxidoreductase [Betaproteobacteria bacterium]
MPTGKRLEDKVALITGASGGQGLAEAELFAREGARVVLADVMDAPGKAMAAKINRRSGEAMYVRLDVTDAKQWRQAIDRVRRRYGALHVLVNNAGVVSRAGIMDVASSDWRRTLDINLTGPLLGMRAAAPLMRDSGGGAIVNIASTAAFVAHFGAAYVASKWGLRGITKTAALEFVDWGIRANSVHPAMVIDTGIADGAAPGFREINERVLPRGRAARPDEIAQAVLFLASDESSYMSGSDVVVDYGYTSFAVARIRNQLHKEYASRARPSTRRAASRRSRAGARR